LQIRIHIAIVFSVLLSFTSCKHRRKVQAAEKPVVVEDTISSRCRLDFKSARALGRYMKEHEFAFRKLNAKANVETNIDGKEESFDIRVSARRDSAMLVTIQYLLGLQVAKVLITKDTVLFVNYVEKTYFKGDFTYINELLNVDLDFDLIQAVLFGNSAEYHDEETRLKPVADRENCHYLLSTERKRRLRRIQAGQQELKDAVQILTLRPDYKIIRNEFTDPATNRRFVASYSNFLQRSPSDQAKDSAFAPYRVDIDISAQKKATVKIDYVRIEQNTPLKLTLNVPAKYDRIQIERRVEQK
jgi:hypothetical protein